MDVDYHEDLLKVAKRLVGARDWAEVVAEVIPMAKEAIGKAEAHEAWKQTNDKACRLVMGWKHG